MAKRFDRLLEKASESTLLEPNWDAILDCVDAIRSGEAPVKQALASIRKRAHNDNPHVAHHALFVLEACVKNCGDKFHAEIATKDVMEDMKHLAMETKADKVKEKILELVQCWANAFKAKLEYKIVVDTHNLMKLEGFEFPSLRESEAMFTAESAPEWADGDECFRCRTTFGLLTRRHHCRACGQIFCDKCSSRQQILPRYGIEKMVRVCETCFNKSQALTKDEKEKSIIVEKDKKSATTVVEQKQANERDVQQREEEELALAMAISQSEAEEKDRQRQMQLYNLYNGPDATTDMPSNKVASDSFHNIASTISGSSYMGVATGTNRESSPSPSIRKETTDPELARYLNRDYWEKRRFDQKAGILARQSPTPSAPPTNDAALNGCDARPNGDLQSGAAVGRKIESPVGDVLSSMVDIPDVLLLHPDDDTENFSAEMKKQVEILENRIRSNQARGRSILNDSSIQSLFLHLTEMHANVLARVQDLDDRRSYFESLQDRIAHIQEARQAVTALREDYERRRQEALMEEQRRRQSQMQEKLGVMRHKKHEMLVQQRYLALQRFQQQEAELQMRKQQAMSSPIVHQYIAGSPMQQQLQHFLPSQQSQFGPVSSIQQQAAVVPVPVPVQYIDQSTGQPVPFRASMPPLAVNSSVQPPPPPHGYGMQFPSQPMPSSVQSASAAQTSMTFHSAYAPNFGQNAMSATYGYHQNTDSSGAVYGQPQQQQQPYSSVMQQHSPSDQSSQLSQPSEGLLISFD